MWFVPESPRWLILRKNDEKRAREILAYSNPGNVDGVIAEIRHAQGEFQQDRLFTRAYTFPVLLAFLFALPLAYLAMNKWLENYAYKTPLSW